MLHSLIRPRIKYGAGSAGTFSRREKGSQSYCVTLITPQATRAPALPAGWLV